MAEKNSDWLPDKTATTRLTLDVCAAWLSRERPAGLGQARQAVLAAARRSLASFAHQQVHTLVAAPQPC